MVKNKDLVCLHNCSYALRNNDAGSGCTELAKGCAEVCVSGTIRSNLCWKNPNATDEELWTALEVAQAADFVREKPEQLDSIVERGGLPTRARAMVKRWR